MPLYAPAAAASAEVWPLSGLGLLAASFSPESGCAGSNIGNNQAFMARTHVPAGTPLTNVWCGVRDAGTWDAATTGSTLGVYTDAGVFVDKITASDALWTTTGWVGGALSAGPVAAQTAARFVYLAALVRGMTVSPTVAFLVGANDGSGNLVWFNTGPAGTGATNRRALFVGSLTSLPGSFNPTSAGPAPTFVPLLAAT